jgi:serine/threonine-protein kinase
MTQIIVQIGMALASIHALGIVHRDVKTENIFLVPNPSGGFTAKLIDFGIAKVAGAAEAGRLTSPGTAILGTPAYMSPEQLENAGEVDGRADLWSLAVVAYVCLTGTLPFTQSSLATLILAIRRGTFVAVTHRRPDLPASLDDWFEKALSCDRRERFGTASEMADAFVRAARGPCLSAETGAQSHLELAHTRSRARRARPRSHDSHPGALAVLAIVAAMTGALVAAPRGVPEGGAASGARSTVSFAAERTREVLEVLPSFIQEAMPLQPAACEPGRPAAPRETSGPHPRQATHQEDSAK